MDFGLFNANASIEVLIRFLTSKGLLKSLAEPNLITLPGKGGHLPGRRRVPLPGSSGWRFCRCRLDRVQGVRDSAEIHSHDHSWRQHRLKVAPEVSALDFSNPLVFGGFTIPSLLSRRTETEVEMKNGQYLAIAGLVDNTMTDNSTKIPLAGRHSDPGPVFPFQGCTPA